MRLLTVVGGMAVMLILMMLLADRIHIGQNEVESIANTQQTANLLTTKSLVDTIETTAATTLPQTISSTIADTDICGATACTYTAVLSADSGYPGDSVSYATVAGGGASQTDENINKLKNYQGNTAVDRGIYRIALTNNAGQVFPMTADVMLIAAPDPNTGNSVTVTISSMRFDADASTTASVQFLDNLCSNASMKAIGCTYHASVSQTMPITEVGCSVPGSGGQIGSACNPLGDTTPAPTITGTISNSAIANQANPSSPVAP